MRYKDRFGLRSISKRRLELRAVRTPLQQLPKLADLPYGPAELVRPPSKPTTRGPQPASHVVGGSNVVRLDRFRERRALEQALQKASRDLTPPTTAS